MAEIGIREFRQHASKILKEVREEGATYTITFQGEPCGILLPYSGVKGKKTRNSRKPKTATLKGILRGSPEVSWEEFMELKKIWDVHVDSLAKELADDTGASKRDNE